MALFVKQVGKFDCLSSPTICNKLYVYQPCLAVFKGKGTGDYEIHHGKGNFGKFKSLHNHFEMTRSLANCICFPKEQFCSFNICYFSSNHTVAFYKLSISFWFFSFFFSWGKQSSDAKRCISSLLFCLFQCHLHNYIQIKFLKMMRTASALGRIIKE